MYRRILTIFHITFLIFFVVFWLFKNYNLKKLTITILQTVFQYLYRFFSSQVFRHDSRKLPIGDPDVDWEETIYLNLIVHQLEYTITLAICSRTSPKDLQVRGLLHNLAAF